jgi:YesN/AraC family two-component response regulator
MSNKPRVLIADDENACRVLIKAIVTSMNCEVVGEAKTGLEAIEMYKKLKPHLLLLDINMPLKTGDEALEEIMRDHPDAFVIILSAVAEMARVEKCLAMGASNYIRKDTRPAEIRAIIKETWQEFIQ